MVVWEYEDGERVATLKNGCPYRPHWEDEIWAKSWMRLREWAMRLFGEKLSR